MILRLAGLLFAVCLTANPANADSSSPLLAAYYDRQMAIVGKTAYGWQGDTHPRRLHDDATQVGVGRGVYYVLTADGVILQFPEPTRQPKKLIDGVARFAAGRTGVLAVLKTGVLWWLPNDGDKQKIADKVRTAAVGDGTNYYVLESGALFVKGRAHRGQYGDGRLVETPQFVQTAAGIAQITAHTGHALLLTRDGSVRGTGGNIYGPVGRHGLGDKAVRWREIVSDAKAIATGSSHSLAILRSGRLMAWGAGYGPDPVPVMEDVAAVSAGSRATVALKTDGSLWQWDRAGPPTRIPIRP